MTNTSCQPRHLSGDPWDPRIHIAAISEAEVRSKDAGVCLRKIADPQGGSCTDAPLTAGPKQRCDHAGRMPLFRATSRQPTCPADPYVPCGIPKKYRKSSQVKYYDVVGLRDRVV